MGDCRLERGAGEHRGCRGDAEWRCREGGEGCRVGAGGGTVHGGTKRGAGWLQRSWGCEFSGCVGGDEGSRECRGEGRHRRDVGVQEGCRGIVGCRRGTRGVQGRWASVGVQREMWGAGRVQAGMQAGCTGGECLMRRMGEIWGCRGECRLGVSTRKDGGTEAEQGYKEDSGVQRGYRVNRGCTGACGGVWRTQAGWGCRGLQARGAM